MFAQPIHNRRSAPRRAQILVTFALLFAALLGMVGLVIDAGFVMVAHRQAQNAADSGALAAAMELFEGYSETIARQAAIDYIKNYNGHDDATVEVNFADKISAAAAAVHRKTNYVEVIVELPVRTFFIQVLGANPTNSVSARAVAGFESETSGEGAIVLDRRADTYSGLSVGGGGMLNVKGGIYVNSLGKGMNQNGDAVVSSYNHYAVTTGNNSRIYCTSLEVLGGIDVRENVYNVVDYPRTPAFGTGTDPYPLTAGLGIGHLRPDPLANVPIPVPQDSGGNPITTRTPAIAVENGEIKNLVPGIYEDIQVNSGGTVNFDPGIYVLSPTKPNQGLRINGASTVNGAGVMFYITGSDYLTKSNAPGYYDALDGAVEMPITSTTLPSPPAGENIKSVDFATVQINANDGHVNLTGIEIDSPTPTSPFKNLLFFQRRRNENGFQIAGNASENVRFEGTIYTKWANMRLSGGGKYDAQFVVGTLDIFGQANITINAGGQGFGVIDHVFLVE